MVTFNCMIPNFGKARLGYVCIGSIGQPLVLRDTNFEIPGGGSKIPRHTVRTLISINDSRAQKSWYRILALEQGTNSVIIHKNKSEVNIRNSFLQQDR